MKIKTQKRAQTSSRSAKTGSSTKRARGPVKKNKKQDNTKLFIGIGVGVFFFLFIIIAAASSGGGDTKSVTYSTGSTKKTSYSLPVSDRKIIYRDYSAIDDKLQDEFQNTLNNLPLEEARKQGSKLKAKKDRELYNAKVDLVRKYKKKYPGLTSSYMNKIVSEGIDKNW